MKITFYQIKITLYQKNTICHKITSLLISRLIIKLQLIKFQQQQELQQQQQQQQQQHDQRDLYAVTEL